MSWSIWRFSETLKSAITSRLGGVKLLNAAGQLADWQVAREHAAVWTEKLDGIENPRLDLCDRPADAEAS